ncbi:hypothetical protein DPMN_088037 [Dreissena polymorpha]|uniref:Uncharacterized protein n=1 Tax=Dreissena polymorpha TaxID=45954 RepID=A0A9D4KTF3_DREPO|nr:hypothetical protein DPMN_088037 [Dreissena polymorpha]
MQALPQANQAQAPSSSSSQDSLRGPRSIPSTVQQLPQTPSNQLSPFISEESVYWTPQQPKLAPQGLSGEAQGTGQVARLVKDVEEARTSAQTKAKEAQRLKEHF